MKNIFPGIAIATALIIYFGISSCTKTGATGPSGPTGPTGNTGTSGPILNNGTVTGFVTALDEYGFRTTAGQAGVSVHINDASNDSTTTNSSGQYTFSNVQTGVYNITFSSPGYGTNIAYDFAVVGNGTQQRNISISKIPAFNLFGVAGIDTTIGTDPGILLRGTDSADQAPRSFIVFASNSSGVTSAPGNYTYVNTGTIKASQTGFSLFIYSQDLHDNGLMSGTTGYFIVYPYSTGAATYVDQGTGKTVYTALGNPTAVFSLNIP